MLSINEFRNTLPEETRFDVASVFDLYGDYCREHLQVGDGVTLCLWSDRHAYTIVKRTAKTLTLRRDRAILSPDFEPHFIVGGFAAHCTNQNDQKYTYEEDPRGAIIKAYWSQRKHAFYSNGCKIRPGRSEYYDYNF